MKRCNAPMAGTDTTCELPTEHAGAHAARDQHAAIHDPNTAINAAIRRHLDASRKDLLWLIDVAPRVLANLTTAINDGYAPSGDSERVSGTPERRVPVETWEERRRHQTIAALASMIAQKTTRLVKHFQAVEDLGVDTSQAWRQTRCTGGEPSTEPWVRPECERLAVTRDGLCDACRQRRDHWKRTAA